MPENPIRQTEENAILLLAAAEELDLPASVVTSNDGALQAPDDVIKKAGLESGEPKKAAQKRAASKKSADADGEEN